MGFAKLDTKLKDAVKSQFDENKVHVLDIDQILVEVQVRIEFENDEQSLESLGEDIKANGLHSPITVRLVDGAYVLVMGERRLRASKLAGLTTILAFVKDIDAKTAKILQYSENVHRKDLTMIEEARYLQGLVDEMGSGEAVLEHLNSDEIMNTMQLTTKKSHAWLSKRLGLLKLPEQSLRLLTENLSGDVEAINMVAQIEKVDPTKAQELVDDFKENRNQSLRAKAKSVKDEVKPAKSKAVSTPAAEPDSQEPASTATPATQQVVPADGLSDDAVIANALGQAFLTIFEHKVNPGEVVKSWDKTTKELVSNHLLTHYNAGAKAKDAARASIQGFRNGIFSEDGALAFAWIAFLHGADGRQQFSMINVLGSVKP